MFPWMNTEIILYVKINVTLMELSLVLSSHPVGVDVVDWGQLIFSRQL